MRPPFRGMCRNLAKHGGADEHVHHGRHRRHVVQAPRWPHWRYLCQERTIPTIFKLIFSEVPTPKRCILSTIPENAIEVCRVGCRERGWRASKEKDWFNDIAFCHRKLYGLARSVGKLMIFDIRITKKGSPEITATY